MSAGNAGRQEVKRTIPIVEFYFGSVKDGLCFVNCCINNHGREHHINIIN